VATHRSPIAQIGGAWVPEQGAPVIEDAPIHLDGGTETCRFFRRETLPPGTIIDAPAVVEEATATTFIPRGWVGTIDAQGNLLLRRA